MKKNAAIRRDDEKPCPFGLHIPGGCANVGDCIHQMTPLNTVPENQKEKVEKANKKIYIYCKSGKPCPYANNILEKQDAVNCSFGGPAAGMGQSPPFVGSPLYPRSFSSVGIGGLYSQPLGLYSDYSSSRNLFHGLFSLVSRQIPRLIKKVAISTKELLLRVKDQEILLPEEQDRLNEIIEKLQKELEEKKNEGRGDTGV